MSESGGENQGLGIPPVIDVLESADRLTWVMQFYYEQINVDPVQIECRGHLLTKSAADEPYTRALTLVPGNPIKFDTGFVECPRMIVIQNITRWTGRTNPSQSVADKYDSSYTIIRIGEACMSLAPGQAQPFWVMPGSNLPQLLTVEGSTDVTRIRMYTFPGGQNP